MKEAESEKKTRSEDWRERIREQERSGKSVKRFCQEHGLTEQSFYLWRKRLREQQPMRFALVETEAVRQQTAVPGFELMLGNGERLRIDAGADPAALRRIVEALRA